MELPHSAKKTREAPEIETPVLGVIRPSPSEQQVHIQQGFHGNLASIWMHGILLNPAKPFPLPQLARAD
jgi:hypothetical protein